MARKRAANIRTMKAPNRMMIRAARAAGGGGRLETDWV